MANPHNLKVGQKLLVVSRTRGGTTENEASIATLGRKWFKLDDSAGWERFSTESLESESQYQQKKCYLSKAQWVDEVARNLATIALFDLFSGWSKPNLSHLSTQEIQEITAKISNQSTKDDK